MKIAILTTPFFQDCKLVKNPDIMQKFAKRNREIAVECFDIEIWREKWRKLIRKFGG